MREKRQRERETKGRDALGAAALADDEPRDVAFVSPLGPLLEAFLGSPLGAADGDDHDSPIATVLEDPESYRVVFAVPGSRAEDLSIEVLRDRVKVRGAKVRDEGRSPSGLGEYAFVRSFRLPFDFDSDSARATFDDGVLTLAFAKRVQPGPRSIEIVSRADRALRRGNGDAR